MNIDQTFLREYFGYSENLQGLYWIKSTSKYANPKIGEHFRAGVTDSIGYRIVTILGKPYKEHRLVWIYYNGNIPKKIQIDHINRIRNDNRISNLRLANHMINGLNTDSKNVTHRKENINRPYEGSYMVYGKTYSKSFSTIEDAKNWVDINKKRIIEENK